MTHYRVPFFEALKEELAKRGCFLQLVYGEPTVEELKKDDSAEIDWAERINTKYFFGGRLCWQPFSKYIKGADLVVITQENKLIYNLIVQYFERSCRIALWGHGTNFQGNASSLRERFKRVVAKRVDWWFAYTDMSLSLIEKSGFPSERITVLNNSIDTTTIINMYESIQPGSVDILRVIIGLKSNNIGVFVGSLYEDKRIKFMLDSVLKIRSKVPDFEFLIVGSGPQRVLVESFCRKHPWVKYLGVRKGREKVNILALAKVMINPGLVGLGILDSFACQVPIVTTDCSLHSPEIAYLSQGYNGLMTENSIDNFALTVSQLLKNEVALSKLKAGCAESAKKYTVENMARNFANGVMDCITRSNLPE